MEFEWDPEKEASNVKKHAISFVAAARVLAGGTTYAFPTDRDGESRWIAMGEDPGTQRVLAIVYTIRGGRYRIISARRARNHEEQEYRKRIKNQG